jgi:hypothetical protein
MRHLALTTIGLLMAAAGAASAAETATATITQTGTTGVDFNYSITLHDTGTTNVGTFWYAWIPGEDFMPAAPVTVTNPGGWNDQITSSLGYAIQWTAGTAGAQITPGNSLTFSFVSPSDLATITGIAPSYPGTLIGTSFIYSGTPFSDGGDQFVVAAPEPAGVSLAGAGGLMAIRRRRR